MGKVRFKVEYFNAEKDAVNVRCEWVTDLGTPGVYTGWMNEGDTMSLEDPDLTPSLHGGAIQLMEVLCSSL
jgi:hypothetical protein